MAKSWKSFVKKDEDLSQDPESSQELSGIEKELNLSLEELAKSNDQLRDILEQRDALEEKMRQLTNPSAKPDQQDRRFESEIESIARKRREDQERFSAKQKLEEKLRLKKQELGDWAKKIKRIREKVTLTQERFERKKDELHRAKKKVDEFVRFVRRRPADDFDYEKLGGTLKKALGDFPFTERMTDRTDEIFNKPVGRVIEKVTEREPVKKIVDAWEELKEKKREAAKIKEQFERAIKKKEELKGKFEDFASKLDDSFGNEDPEKNFNENSDDEEPPEKKSQEEKKKKSIFERLMERRKAKKEEGKGKKKKSKGFSTDDLDDTLRGFGRGLEDDFNPDKEEDEEKEQDEEKERDDGKNEEEESLERRDEKRRKRKEERIAERKENRERRRFGIDSIEPASGSDNSSTDDSGEADERKKAEAEEQRKAEAAEQKRKEEEENEKNESRKQEKIKDRIAQRREERRQEERHERRKRVKDKYD